MFREELEAMADPPNALFLSKLVPTLEKERILGIRNPSLRSLAKKLRKERFDDVVIFLDDTPHYYLDENMLHAFLITEEKDMATCLELVEKFLPYVDNWAVCDSLNPKIFKKNPSILHKNICAWMNHEHLYTQRFGVGMLMQHFLEENFHPDFHINVAHIKTDEYYLQMMIAWYFATALAKQPEATMPWFSGNRLCDPIRRKAIQKALESRRIPEETKEILRGIRSDIPRSSSRSLS